MNTSKKSSNFEQSETKKKGFQKEIIKEYIEGFADLHG